MYKSVIRGLGGGRNITAQIVNTNDIYKATRLPNSCSWNGVTATVIG
jgi:hypothetical protein